MEDKKRPETQAWVWFGLSSSLQNVESPIPQLSVLSGSILRWGGGQMVSPSLQTCNWGHHTTLVLFKQR